MGDHLIRNVPDDTWKKLRVLAAHEGKTLSAIIVELITVHVNKAAKPS